MSDRWSPVVELRFWFEGCSAVLLRPDPALLCTSENNLLLGLDLNLQPAALTQPVIRKKNEINKWTILFSLLMKVSWVRVLT